MRVFDEIKAYADSGKDINQFLSNEAVLFLFLPPRQQFHTQNVAANLAQNYHQ